MIKRRPPLAELARQCQKLGHQELGTWLARRVSRPLALRITWLLLPWPVSAHAATLFAWGAALAAAVALASGTLGGWLLAGVLLQVWYLGDHVDGQLARYRQTESLDGVQLDYLMHHSVNWLIPLAAGLGLSGAGPAGLGTWCGLLWSGGALLLGLENDTRTKAFEQRLKRVRGALLLIGGGGGRPSAAPYPSVSLWAIAGWALRKACEMHVVMHLLALLALADWVVGQAQPTLCRVYLLVMALVAPLVAGASLARSQRSNRVETSFKQWYRLPAGHELLYAEGYWQVLPCRPCEAPAEMPPRRRESA